MHYIVYKTTNLKNGKYYIGIHKQEVEGFDGYFGSGLLLNLAITKYGIENFQRITLYNFDNLYECREKEKYIVNEKFCKNRNNYNISVGGQGGNTLAGYSKEQKEIVYKKMGDTQCGVPVRPELYDMYKQMMLKCRIQPDNKGKKHTGQQLLNMINNNHMVGKKHITNGIENSLIYNTEPIPNGWRYGRTLLEHQKFKGHSKEIVKSMADKRRNKIYVNNGTINKLVNKKEILTNEWVPGLLRHKTEKLKFITNDIIERKIPIDDTLPKGWRYGRKKFKKNKRSI